MSEIDDFLTRWTQAERTADVATLDTMLTDDFVGVGPLGLALPKPAWLGRHQSGVRGHADLGPRPRRRRRLAPRGHPHEFHSGHPGAPPLPGPLPTAPS
jgi:hypothetical protein